MTIVSCFLIGACRILPSITLKSNFVVMLSNLVCEVMTTQLEIGVTRNFHEVMILNTSV